MISRLREMILLLYSTLVKTHFEFCIWMWSPWYKRVVDLLEHIQRRTTKMIHGVEHLPYEDRMRELGLFSLEKRRIQRDLIATFQYLKGSVRRKRTDSLVGSVVIGQGKMVSN